MKHPVEKIAIRLDLPKQVEARERRLAELFEVHMNNSAIYTVAEIARALGKGRTAVARALGETPADGCRAVAGGAAKAWSLAALPGSLQGELETTAARLGFRNPESLLSDPDAAPRWTSPLSVEKIKPRFLARAVKLQAALLPALSRLDDSSLDEAGFYRLAIADYARAMGYGIKERQMRRLIERTVERDRGAKDWNRVDIFIEEAAFATHQAGPETVKTQFQHRELNEVVQHLENREQPTPDDRAFLFDAAFHHYEKLSAAFADKPDAKRQGAALKRSLLHYLHSAAPALSKTAKALRRVFELNLLRWQAGGRTPGALQDNRRQASGNFRRPDFTEDEKKIKDLAIMLEGNETLAYRELRTKGHLSQGFLDYFEYNIRRAKSYLPHSVRHRLTPEVEMCGPLRQGPHEARMRGPYIPRDWSDVHPGDYFSGDDVTWNSYFYYYDDQGELHIERGECLVLTDLRTGYPLDFLLIAGKYNSRHIRSLLLKAHDRVGLPRIGTYFERSVWASRFISGDKKNQHHWRDTQRGLLRNNVNLGPREEMGISEPGLDLITRNATTPRAKTIEGIFHILQDRQKAHPGYVGPNEQVHKMERMQDFLARCRRGKTRPSSELLAMDDWAKLIRKDLEAFANEPQNGKMLPGVSPAEAFRHGINAAPLKKLAHEDRYILATHKQPVKVRQNGIVLKIGGQDMVYCNERTGPLIGREMLAFYNVECPDLLTVSDMNRQNYFTVKRIALPAMTATKEQFAVVKGQVAGHMKHARTVYGNIDHALVATVTRDNLTSPESKEMGRFQAAELEQHKLDKTATARKMQQVQTLAAAGGIEIGHAVRNPDRVLRGIEMEKEALRKLELEEAQP